MPPERYPTLPYTRERLEPRQMIERLTALLEKARERRSVREFSHDPVPLDAIRLAIDVANTAPSGANMQPWTFVVVSDADTKTRIREAAEQEEKINYDGRMPPEWLEALAPLQTDWRKEFLETAPVLIVVFARDYSLAGGRKRKHYYVTESVGLATGMLLHALNEAGLATLTHTPSPMKFLTEILGRPPGERPFLLIPVGHPADGCRVPDIRKKSGDEVTVLV